MINVSFKKSTLINQCFLCNRAWYVLRISFTNLLGDNIKTIDLCDACKQELRATLEKVTYNHVESD